jgi:hypothetical protein
MKPSTRKSIPPTNCYAVVNGFIGLLWIVGIPVLFCTYSSAPLWVKIPVVALWVIVSGRIVDRYIPRITNPVIEWIYERVSNR